MARFPSSDDSNITDSQQPPPTQRGGVVSAATTGSADLESQLLGILQLAMEKTAASGAAIAISTHSAARCRASIGSALYAGSPIPPGMSLTALCIATSEILISNDTHIDPRLDSPLCEQANIRSIFALPIKEDPRVLGVLELISDVPNAFSPQDIPAMNELADVAAPLLSEPASGSDEFVRHLRRNIMEAQGKRHDTKLERSILRMKILIGVSALVFLALIVDRYARHYPRVGPLVTPSATVVKDEPILLEQGAAAPEQGSEADRQSRAPENVVTASTEEVISVIQEPVQDADPNRTLNQANTGAVTAQYEMGLRYADGEGVLQNYHDAMTWFAKASDAGNAKAQWKLALGYLKGIGVPRDVRQAVVWLKRAANNGDTRAQRALSEMYLSGHDVPRDYVRAYTWANIAAELEGNDKAQLQTIRSQMTPIQIAIAERRTSIWRDYASRGAAPKP
jgi:GAF domain/Sel1 repeat